MGCRLLVLAALVLVVATALAPGASAKGKKPSCKGTKVTLLGLTQHWDLHAE